MMTITYFSEKKKNKTKQKQGQNKGSGIWGVGKE